MFKYHLTRNTGDVRVGRRKNGQDIAASQYHWRRVRSSDLEFALYPAFVKMPGVVKKRSSSMKSGCCGHGHDVVKEQLSSGSTSRTLEIREALAIRRDRFTSATQPLAASL